MKLMAKIDHFLGSEGSSIVCNDPFRAAKPGQDIGFKELNDGGIIFLSTWDGFNPLGKIICGCQDPLMLT